MTDVKASETASLEVLRAFNGENCIPSEESVAELIAADVVLLAGRIMSGGKSRLTKLFDEQGRLNIPSWTNRELRPNEKEGVDKIHATLANMAELAAAGYFLEIEEVRPGFFYATPPEFKPGNSYVKDLDLIGAFRLRRAAPSVPFIVPLPPTYQVEAKKVTEWEKRTVEREDFQERITDSAVVDLAARLSGIIDEVARIEETGLVHDPNTLIIVNYDLDDTFEAANRFLATGEKSNQSGIEQHIRQLSEIAADALALYPA